MFAPRQAALRAKPQAAAANGPVRSQQMAVPAHEAAGASWRFDQLALRPRLGSPGFGPQPRPNASGISIDHTEREAEAAASAVMSGSGPVPWSLASPGTASPGTATSGAAGPMRDGLMRDGRRVAPGLGTLPAAARPALATAGRPLDPRTRSAFEARLDVGLGAVRIHDDPVAAASARGVGARAFTAGSHIVFGAAEYDPASRGGQALLAHELTHVRQDMGSATPGTRLYRAPCPACHKPAGVQEVQLLPLSRDDVHYLPDDDATEFWAYLHAGYTWARYRGGERTMVEAIHYDNFDGTSQIRGYVLHFDNPQGGVFPQPILTIDVHGNLLGETTFDPEAIKSVMSPVDFIGPGLLARPLVGGARAMGGLLADAAPEVGSMLANTGRSLALSGRLATSSYLGAGMRGAGELPAIAMMETEGVGAGMALREAGQVTAGSSMAGQASFGAARTLGTAPSATAAATGSSFADVSAAVGLEAAGTVRYASTAAAFAGAQAGGLVTANRPGFQSHSTASSVRRAGGMSGSDWESAHVLPQAVYRGLRVAGIRTGAQGQAISPGRAMTTLLDTTQHAVLDNGWIPQWNAAAGAGRQITAGDVYGWVSRAVDGVSDSLINPSVKGALHDRLRSEIFVELGLAPGDVVLAARP